MAEHLIERVSAIDHALSAHVPGSAFAVEEVPNLVLHQFGAWPETAALLKQRIEEHIGSRGELSPQHVAVGDDSTAIWIEPTKFWLLGPSRFPHDADLGTTLDLSHAFCHLRLAGEKAAFNLNGFLPLDLRAGVFSEGATAASAIHHVPVRLWRWRGGYHLLLPRSFACSITELLCGRQEGRFQANN